MTEPKADLMAKVAQRFSATEVPAEVTRVEGCDCGGLNMHLTTCSFWRLDHEEQVANRDDALRRLDDHTAALKAGLRAWLERQ